MRSSRWRPQTNDQGPIADQVFELLQGRGPLDASHICEHLGISIVEAQRAITELAQEGSIVPYADPAETGSWLRDAWVDLVNEWQHLFGGPAPITAAQLASDEQVWTVKPFVFARTDRRSLA